MRIICRNFRDYYDSAAGHGSDPDLVYVREPKNLGLQSELGKEYNLGPLGLRCPLGEQAYYADPSIGAGASSSGLFYLGFCGRLYPGVVGSVASYPRSRSGVRLEVCWTVRELQALRETYKEAYYRRGRRLHRFEPDWMDDVDLRALEEGPVDEPQLFMDAQSPILFCLTPKRTWTGRLWRDHLRAYLPVAQDIQLEPWGFARVFDAYSAFQEISMFLSGVLGLPGNPTVEIADEHRIKAHGYDEQSFRKTGPTGRKARKKHRSK